MELLSGATNEFQKPKWVYVRFHQHSLGGFLDNYMTNALPNRFWDSYMANVSRVDFGTVTWPTLS